MKCTHCNCEGGKFIKGQQTLCYICFISCYKKKIIEKVIYPKKNDAEIAIFKLIGDSL